MGDLKDTLSIVLPVFNEEGITKRVIQEVYDNTCLLDSEVEIIAVNDGSTDSTSEILYQMSQSLLNLKIVTHVRNEGYGAALCSGIKSARKQWILLMDSDNQVHIDSLKDVWPYRFEYDVLLGYRQKRSDSFYRLVLGALGNRASNFFLKRNIFDINCGFKIFRKKLLEPLLLSSKGGIINFEILYCLFKNSRSLRLYQFSVKHYPRVTGRSTGGSPKVILKIISESIKIILNNKS